MKKKKKRRKYDPFTMRPIEPSLLTAYRLYLPDGETRILLWPPGASIREAHAHVKRVHPEFPAFRLGVVGVGEFIVDQIDHAWIPDPRTLDQDGCVVVRRSDQVRPADRSDPDED